MMSANEFFDSGPEPPWLVDACGGEIVNPNLDVEFHDVAFTSPPYLEVNHSNEAGPSNYMMHMDVDEENSPNDPSFANHYPRQELGRSVQNVNSGIVSMRPPGLPLLSEQRGLWIRTGTPNVPSRVPTRRFAPAPADELFRECKKRKRSYV